MVLIRERNKIKFVDVAFGKDKLQDSGKKEEGKTSHVLQVFELNVD